MWKVLKVKKGHSPRQQKELLTFFISSSSLVRSWHVGLYTISESSWTVIVWSITKAVELLVELWKVKAIEIPVEAPELVE